MAASSRATMRLRSSSVFRFSGRAKCDDASQWGSLLIQARAAHRASSSSVNNNSGFIARSPRSRAGPDTDYLRQGAMICMATSQVYGGVLERKSHKAGRNAIRKTTRIVGGNYWKFPNFEMILFRGM